jgi:hypothetical protein
LAFERVPDTAVVAAVIAARLQQVAAGKIVRRQVVRGDADEQGMSWYRIF